MPARSGRQACCFEDGAESVIADLALRNLALEDSGLKGRKLADEAALWLVHPKANVLSAKVRVFMDFLLDRIGKSPAWA